MQLIIVDNDLPAEVVEELTDSIMLTLLQESRLIGVAPTLDEATES